MERIAMHERLKKEIKEWTEAIVWAVILAFFIRAFGVQAFKIPSGSMIPTFRIGDRIFVNKFIYGARIPFTDIRLPKVRDPKTGDIVVFRSTEDPKKDFVKRLIASGGDTVQIRDGVVCVNGEKVERPQVMRSIYYYNRGDYGEEGKTVTVPKDSYYLLGDNSSSSRDSRYWGFVPKRNLIGKAILIYWPVNRIRMIKES
jgi:signal peptidase I